MRAIAKKDILDLSDLSSFMSYKGWIKWADCHNLYEEYMKPVEIKLKKQELL